MMTLGWDVLLAGLTLLAGLLVGAIGIGGVIIVPVYTELGGMAADEAIALALAGFLFTGILAAVWPQRQLPLDWRAMGYLVFTCLLSAAAGTLLLGLLPTTVIQLLVAAALLATGLNSIRPAPPTAAVRPVLRRRSLVAIGVVVGCGSAISGTGGPVLLMPMLLALRYPIRETIRMAQIIQIPVALAATLVNTANGNLQWSGVLWVAVILVVGALLGMRLGRLVDGALLKRVIAIGLIVLGIWYGVSVFG